MNFYQTPLFFRLLAASPFSTRELGLAIITAPERYKDHFIEKRNGRGRRLISQPTAEIKHLQRLIVQHEFASLRLHDSAVGYRAGMSILNHAAPHAKERYLLKLDFKDFFPSLKESAICHCLKRDASFSEEELWIVSRVLCRKDLRSDLLQLSIGAPSSPFVSNYLMFEFDTLIFGFCQGIGVRYTRYADDLAFSTSTPHLLDVVYEEVRRLLSALGYLGVSLNEQKTVNVSTKNRRTLVGLNLSNQGTASIGRDAKRTLRAAMHNLSKGKLSSQEVAKLRGQLAFVHAIDPDFVASLCTKYGYAKISDIQSIHVVM